MVEKLPHLQHSSEVFPCNLMKLSFRRVQLLFVLSAHHLQVEFEESLDVRHLLNLQCLQSLVQLMKHREEPQIELWPIRREVIVHQYRRYKGQLLVRLGNQNDSVWSLNE